MLASDANAVQETVNNQIIKPLYNQLFGASNEKPIFRFRLKGTQELQEIATVLKTLKEAGLPIMSPAVTDAWKDDGGVRRPITLQSKTERDAEIEAEEEMAI